jgi:hypothetical protein
VQGAFDAAPFAIGPSNTSDTQVYKDALTHAERMFDAVREASLSYGISNYVRAALLQPMTSVSMRQACSPLCDCDACVCFFGNTLAS